MAMGGRSKDGSPVYTRNTRQKRAIVACLAQLQDKHVTADELVAMLRDSPVPVGQATVYRVIKALEADGVVKKHFITGGSSACYQYVGDSPECNQHLHLVCDVCGDIFHLDSDLLDAFIESVAKKNHFAIDTSKISFYGCCRQCRKK